VDRDARLRSCAPQTSQSRLAVLALLGKLHRPGRFIAGGGGGLIVAAGAYLLLGIFAGPVQAEQRTESEQLPLRPCRIDRIEEELLN
jgi:hypothetical protein